MTDLNYFLTNDGDSGRTRVLKVSAQYFLLTFIAYLYVVNCGFIWDDDAHVLMDPSKWSLANLWRIWFTKETQQYYPLVYTSFWIEGNIWGVSPMASHLVNVGLHALNAVLVYVALKRLNVKGAWLAGLIFALHPVHVESVAWISERKNVLSGSFYLLAFLSFLKFEESSLKRWYLGSLLLFLCALLSKTVSSTLPAVLIVVLWMTGKKIDFKKIALLAPFFLLGLVFGLITIWWETNMVGASGNTFDIGYIERVLLAGRVVWFYLAKLLFPFGLIFIYPRWQMDAMALWQWFFPIAAFVTALSLFYYSKAIGRQAFASFAFFGITLFPALGFFNVYPFKFSFVADHFQYLASIGPISLFAGVAAWGAETAEKKWKRFSAMKAVLPVLLFALLGALTFRQTLIYKDAETVWQDTLNKNPNAWIAHNNIGLGFLSKGEYDTALGYFEKAYELNPSDAIVNYNLGLALFNVSNVFTSSGDGQRALECNERAIKHYREALAIKPGYADAHVNLGVALVKYGEYDDAIDHYRKALFIKPELGFINNNIEIALRLKMAQGEGPEGSNK